MSISPSHREKIILNVFNYLFFENNIFFLIASGTSILPIGRSVPVSLSTSRFVPSSSKKIEEKWNSYSTCTSSLDFSSASSVWDSSVFFCGWLSKFFDESSPDKKTWNWNPKTDCVSFSYNLLTCFKKIPSLTFCDCTHVWLFFIL